MTRARHLPALTAALALLASLAAPGHADLFGRDAAEGAAPGAHERAEQAPVPAYTPEALVAALPWSWHGTFAWDDDSAFYVEMDIVSLTVEPDGDVAFNADTRWLPELVTARMSGRIDPATLAVRIWEIPDDAGAADFASDGMYTGVIAADLWDLRARWQTNGSGESGTLVLVTTAVPATAE